MAIKLISTVYGLLPDNLKCAKLEALCDKYGIQTGPFGSQLHKKDYVKNGTPIITVEHLGENRIEHANLPLVSDEDKKRLSKYHLRAGDIVFSRVGSVDRRALVQNNEDGWLFSGRCLRVRPKREFIDSRWLSYFFGTSQFKKYIRGIAVGATMPSINTNILSNVPIYFPPLDIQHKSADFLVAIDDRITLLRETNTTLESIAQTIFKSWFVDFDPVRAKSEGRVPEGIDAETAALFPDSFEESELGLVPKGWISSTIGQQFILTMGQSPPGNTYNESGDGLPFYQGRTDFGFRFPSKRVYCNAPTRLAECGDILISVRAPVGDINIALEKCCLGRGVAGIRHPNGYQSFALYVMQNLRSHFDKYECEGTVFGSINKNDFQGLPVIVAPEVIMQAFDKLTSSLDARININEVQIRTLTDLRDTLLPRLISGQLQLPDELISEHTK